VPETKKAAGASEGQATANLAQHADEDGAPAGAAGAANGGAAGNSAGAASGSGPYLHPVELVVEGRYLDVVAYLRALEGLPWRFYWRVLQLETKTYPLNRVRIELSTVSLDKEWIGV
jgi:MSHA biogenesis protein MshJ